MIARALLLISFFPVAIAKNVQIEAMRHDIQPITAANFDGVIAKFRDSQVSSLWFYKPSNAADNQFLDSYNEVAKTLKNMVRVCAIDCDAHAAFCKKHDVKETPTVMMFPNNPVPAFKWEGKLETKAISSKLQKLIPDYSIKITKENVDAFLTTEPTKPKVVLFSDKKTPATLFKALTSDQVFQRTVKFGFVSGEEKEVISKLKVKKFPTFMSVAGSKSELKETYSGEMSFMAIRDWVNLRSESGMGDKTFSAGGKAEESIEEAKPWLIQEVPELTLKSHQDICFKGEGLCVIYLQDGEASPEDIDMLTGLSKKFTSQLSGRGAKMKWMWMNMKIEANFKKLFEPSELPSAVVFNPHKRLRFTKLDHGEDGEVKGNEVGLSNLMDKVLGGDARFKIVPGQKLPGWASRDDKKKQEL